jgi:hypothetical protein
MMKTLSRHARRLPFLAFILSRNFATGGALLAAGFSTAAATNAPPAISSQPQSQAVLAGGTATFVVAASGAAPLAYQWFVNSHRLAGATGSTLTLGKVQPSQAGNYNVVVGNPFGSVTSSNAALTVNTLPVITDQPDSLTVVVGAAVHFDVGATGSSPLTYRWLFNSAYLAGATNSTLTLYNASPDQDGNYSVMVGNAFGSVTSSSAVLAMDKAPTVTSQPLSLTILTGQTARFTVVAAGTAPLAYQWSLNGKSIRGGTNSTLILGNAQPSQAGSYAVLVSNPVGSAASSNAVLTIHAPPVITSQPQSPRGGAGHTATLTVGVSGSAPVGYQWRFNGAFLAGATNSGLVLNNAQPDQSGNYSVVINNIFGSVTSSNALVTIGVPPAITAQPQNLGVHAGRTAQFTVGASGSAPLAYQWRFNGKKLSGATNATLTFTNAQASQAGSYSVLVSNPVGYVLSSNAVLTVLTPLAITAQPQSVSVIAGQNAYFTVIAVGTAPLAYQWEFNGTNIVGATGSTLRVGNAQTAQAGVYAALVSNGTGSIKSSNAVLTVNFLPSITTQPLSQTTAVGSKVTFRVVAAGTAPLSYQWRFKSRILPGATASSLVLANVQSTNAGGYSVVVSNIAGGITSGTATLYVVAPPLRPVITRQPQNQTTVPGGTAVFSVAATSATTLSYQWRFNGSLLPGATGAYLVFYNAQPDQDGLYGVVVSNSAGVTISSNATLSVPLPPVVTLAVSPSLVTNNFSGNITLVVNGLTNGQTVRVCRFYLVSDPEAAHLSLDPLLESFTVTDGQAPAIGGIRNVNVPGDDDGATNGRVQVNLPFLGGLGGVGDGAIGSFVFLVTDPSGGFSPLTQTLTVAQKFLPQGVTGQVTAGGQPVPGALVTLIPQSGPGGVTAPVDSNGGFTLYAPAGGYNLYALKGGLVGGSAGTALTIATNQMATNNPVLAASSLTISGGVVDAANGAGLAGIPVLAQSTNGSVSAAFTDLNGLYALPAAAGQWSLKPDGGDLSRAGYLALEAGRTITVTNSSVTNVTLSLPKAGALIYGTIAGTNHTPIVGATFYALASAGSFGAGGASMAPNGNFALGVLAGTWSVGADSGPLSALGFSPVAATNVTVTTGQAVPVNFSATPR